MSSGGYAMNELHTSLDLGMLCRCCDCRSYELPKMEGLSASQVKSIEELCKLCIESSKMCAVND